jgi:Niemann-Pick C1 protein
MVFCSLVISGGLCSYAGVKANVVVRDVVPVLILALGVDSIFMLVSQFRHLGTAAYMNTETRLGETLAQVGNPITLNALCKFLAFILGALTDVPAIQSVAYFAATAVIFGYLLNITCVCAIMVLDEERTKV